MNIWYVKKDKKTTKQKAYIIIRDLFLAITIPISYTVTSHLYSFYYKEQYTIIYIIVLILMMLLITLTISSKLFNKKRSNHVFIKDKDNKLIYCYLYHTGFNHYTPKKFYEESINMEKNLKDGSNKKSIFYDIATTKQNYSEYGQCINKIYSIEEYKDYYEVYLSNPKNKILVEAILVPKHITNIESLLEELHKIKSLES